MHTPTTRRGGAVSAVVALALGVALAGCTRPVADSDAPPPTMVASSRCHVVGPGSGSDPSLELSQLREACERARPAVARLWPDWTGTALVVVSTSELDPGTAAYVEGVARDGEPAQADRLVVAPGLTEGLSGEGLDIVFRHELTHLAMRATGTAPLPLWVSEGIAMHAGYAAVPDARRERRSELERLRSRVESGAWSRTVPDESLFEDPGRRSEAYTAAWLGIEILLEHHGLDRVTDAMRRPASQGPSAVASLTDDDRTVQFLGSLGVSRQWLEDEWRAELMRRTS